MIEPVPTDDTTQNPGDGGSGGVTTTDVGTATVADGVIVTARPDTLPEDLWDAEAGAPKYDTIAERVARAAELEAEAEARKAGVPASADEYKLDLPDTVVGLDGGKVQLIADNPMTKAAQALAAKWGLPQEAFTEFVAFHAGGLLQEQRDTASAFEAETKAELAKLGDGGPARIKAVETNLKARFGDKAEAALNLMGSAEAVEVLEQLLAAATNPAISATPQAEAGTQTLAQRLYGS